MRNRVKQALAEGEPVIGTICTLGDPAVVQLLAATGFDWVLIDVQHGTWDRPGVAAGVAGAWAGGAVPVARSPTNAFTPIGELLDEGALGIVAPLVESPEEATRLVEATRYPPGGRRSMGVAGALAYGPDYVDRIEEALLAVVQIETRRGLERADEIMAIDGIDACWIGPADLAASIGVPMGSPAHDEAVREVVGACARNGKAAGIATSTGEDAIRWIEAGCTLVSVGIDRHFVASGAERDIRAVRGALGREHPR